MLVSIDWVVVIELREFVDSSHDIVIQSVLNLSFFSRTAPLISFIDTFERREQCTNRSHWDVFCLDRLEEISARTSRQFSYMKSTNFSLLHYIIRARDRRDDVVSERERARAMEETMMIHHMFNFMPHKQTFWTYILQLFREWVFSLNSQLAQCFGWYLTSSSHLVSPSLLWRASSSEWSCTWFFECFHSNPLRNARRSVLNE